MCDGAGLAATLIEALRVGFALLEAIAHERARTGWARGALARQQQHAANHARARGLLDGAIHCLFALVDAHAAAKRRVLLHLSELVDAQARTDGVSRAQLVRLCKLVFAGERELCRGADRALPRMLCAFCSDGVRALFAGGGGGGGGAAARAVGVVALGLRAQLERARRRELEPALLRARHDAHAELPVVRPAAERHARAQVGERAVARVLQVAARALDAHRRRRRARARAAVDASVRAGRAAPRRRVGGRRGE